MRIAVIYDGAAAGGSRAVVAGMETDARSAAGAATGVAPDVAGVLEAVEAVTASLAALGQSPVPIGVRSVDGLAGRLAGVDLVFNLAEGLDGRAEGEAVVVAALEELGVPVTGARSAALSLCRRKDRVNALLESRGVPIPPWTLATGGAAPEWGRFPAIVKPAGEDGSVGIGDDSVVDDALALRAALERLGGEALVQRFVPGRELNVGFAGGVVLPVAEIEFAGRQRVVSYAAKWEAGSDADLSTRAVCPARIPAELRDCVVEVAMDAWSAVGGTGYGRVDLRTDEAGRPFVLEVNPNPDLAPGAGLARMAGAAGWSYTELVRRILEEARS